MRSRESLAEPASYRASQNSPRHALRARRYRYARLRLFRVRAVGLPECRRHLERTAREQSVMGRPIKSGSTMAGDIVAFNHPRRGYHTGIYLGGGSFIHSPGRGKSVSIAAQSDPLFQLHLHRCPQSPVQGIRRRSHQSSWRWTPQPTSPTRPPLLNQSAPLRENKRPQR